MQYMFYKQICANFISANGFLHCPYSNIVDKHVGGVSLPGGFPLSLTLPEVPEGLQTENVDF
jgi:hypothetical protein